MTLDQATLTLKTMVKTALPSGLVRAAQVFRERGRPLQQSESDRTLFERNEVVVDGKRIYSRAEAPRIEFQIDGQGHSIQINHPTGPGTLHVIARPGTSGCRLEFGTGNRIVSNVSIYFADSGGSWAKESIVRIGDSNLFNGNVDLVAGIFPSTRVEIGNENLFADGIQILGAVEHLTYNVATMARESVERGVRIEDRVWVCKETLLLNNSEIASNNIVAARAVTTKKFAESNTVIAGAPAKVTKRGVMWHVHTNDDYLAGGGPLAHS